MRRLIARCPAKINLGLVVFGKRPDGYHEIATLLQAIGMEDLLTAEPADGLSLTCDDPSLPTDERNLVLRAARLLHDRVPRAAGRGVRFTLRKTIPVGAGLGGGSSDAAGALRLLEALWGLELGRERRRELAAELGSDVPFFLAGGTALGTGRGERIETLPPIEERAVVVGTPPFPLSTARVYEAMRAPLTRSGADVTVSQFFGKLAAGNDFARATNDLEPVAFAMRDELVAFKDALLRAGAEPALLSGSGSSVFGLFGASGSAEPVASQLRPLFPGWAVRSTRTVAWGARLTDESTLEGRASS